MNFFKQLTKDQIQKILLSAMGFVILLYVYFSFFLGPLNKSRSTMSAKIDDLQTKLSASKSNMSKTASLEREAKTATTRFAAFKALNPEGAPIAWFPPRMKSFFANQQIDRALAKLDASTAFKEKELSEWMNYTWTIDIPQADFDALGKSVAALENTEPLLSVTKIKIRALPDTPQFQQVALTTATIIQKR